MTMTNRKATGQASGTLVQFIDDSQRPFSPTLETVAKLLLGRLPESRADWAVVGRRVGCAGRNEPYSATYMKYVARGNHHYTKEVKSGIRNLIAEILAEPPDVDYQSVSVKVPKWFNVPEGTVIQRDARVCVCGATFIPTAWNQINHTKACAKMRARSRTK